MPLQKDYALWKFPDGVFHTSVNPFTAPNISSANSRAAMYGDLDGDGWAENETKTITGIELTYDFVTVGTGSTYRISMHDVGATGNPFAPASTELQLVDINPSTLTPNTRIAHTFGGGLVVSKGQRIFVQFRWSTFGASSNVGPRLIQHSGFYQDLGFVLSSNNGTTWSINAGAIPAVVFLCSDGSRLHFRGAGMEPLSFSNATVFHTDSTGTDLDGGDERGMLWVPRRAYDLTGATFQLRLPVADSAADLVVYRDTTVLQSRSVTAVQNRAIGQVVKVDLLFNAPVRVSPGENIRVVIKPTNASGAQWYRVSYSSQQNIRTHYWGGDEFEPDLRITNRVDGGAWNEPAGGEAAFMPCNVHGKRVALPGEHVLFRR